VIITLQPRTSFVADPKVLEIQIDGQPVRYELDLNAPTQRYIDQNCCQAEGMLYEASTVLVLATTLKSGDVFVDVGAHVGYFSMIAASLVGPRGRVIAFEPNPENFLALQRNAALNAYPHVVCVNSAVGEQDGSVTFYNNADNDGGHALWDPGLHDFNRRSRVCPEPVTVPMTTLDAALARLRVASVKAVKIDTEGAEVRVLQGARHCLSSESNRLLVCENNEFGLQSLGSSSLELRNRLRQFGFVVCVTDADGRYREIDPAAPLAQEFVENFYCFRMD
jgi:FkbM family methyltransferase